VILGAVAMISFCAAALFTGAVVAVLVMLSIILTASVLFPDMGEQWIVGVLAGGCVVLAILVTVGGSCTRFRATQCPLLTSRGHGGHMNPLAEGAVPAMRRCPWTAIRSSR